MSLRALLLLRPLSSTSAPTRLFKEASGKYLNAHHSNAESQIKKIAPILVASTTAVCDGGGGALGHPVEYIQLATRHGNEATCKYCGLRYALDPHAHHGTH